MTDQVAKFLSNARGAEYGFMGAVAYALEQFGQKNNKPIYALIAFTNGKKFGSYQIEEGYTITQFSTPLKRILARALSDVKFVFKDGKAGVKVGKNGGLNHDVLREMQDVLALYNGRVGLRSDVFKEMFPVVKKAKTVDDVDAKTKARDNFLKYVKKMCDEHGFSNDAVIAMLQAKPTDTRDLDAQH